MRLRLHEAVLRGRVVILGLLAIVSVLAMASYAHLRVENRIDAWFSPTDPDYLRFRDFRDRFGAEDVLFVVVHAPDLFTRDVLARVDRLTRAVARLPHVTRVVGLTSIEDVTGGPEGIEVQPLVPRLDLDAAALARLRARVLDDPFFPGTIVSADGRTTAIAIELGGRTSDQTAALVDAVDAAIAAAASPGLEIHLAGWPSADLLMDRLTQRDLRRGFPLAAGVLSLCVALAFGSLRVVAIVLAAVFLTIGWTMGAFAALGFEGTFVTVSALPGILLPLALATAVHVVARFREEVALGPDPRRAMHRALGGVALPVVLTSATTAVGFGSLAVATIPPLRHLGLFVGLGMGITCLLSLTFVPIALVAFPGRLRLAQHAWLGRGLGRLADFDRRHATAIFASSALLAVAGVLGALQLRPAGSTLHYLPDDSPPVRAMRFIEDHFGGGSEFEVVVSGPPDAFVEPAAARTVAAVEAMLLSHPEVTSAVAYTDLLRRMNRALHDGDPGAYRLPETREAIAQELLLYETAGGRDLSMLVDTTAYDTARVSGRMTSFIELEEVERLHADVERRLAALAPRDGPPLRLEIGGDGPLWLRQNLGLFDTMAWSFLLALAGISLMMILLAGSVRLGLLAMIPNVLPVLMGVGTMGWIGIHLDFVTMIIASAALGLAVDDTIHYVVRYRREVARDGDPAAAARRALATVGKAMVSTSVVLCLGMGALVTSAFPPHRTFALVMAATIAYALAADLLLLPALLEAAGRLRLPSGLGARGFPNGAIPDSVPPTPSKGGQSCAAVSRSGSFSRSS